MLRIGILQVSPVLGPQAEDRGKRRRDPARQPDLHSWPHEELGGDGLPGPGLRQPWWRSPRRPGTAATPLGRVRGAVAEAREGMAPRARRGDCQAWVRRHSVLPRHATPLPTLGTGSGRTEREEEVEDDQTFSGSDVVGMFVDTMEDRWETTTRSRRRNNHTNADENDVLFSAS